MEKHTGRRPRTRAARCFPGSYYCSGSGTYIPIAAYCAKYFCSLRQIRLAVHKRRIKAITIRKRQCVEDREIEFGRDC